MDAPRGALTRIDGGIQNDAFGEELLGGLDYDGDGNAEFFIGDLTGDGTRDQSRPFGGVGYVIFNARWPLEIDLAPGSFDQGGAAENALGEGLHWRGRHEVSDQHGWNMA